VQLPLARYHPIGNRRCIALVGADASIDWWVPGPPSDDPLAHRLIDPAGGHLGISFVERTEVAANPGSVQPARPFAPATTVTLRNASAVVTITDQVVESEAATSFGLTAGTLLRLIAVHSGQALLRHLVVPAARWDRPRRIFTSSDGVAWTSPAAVGGSRGAIVVRGGSIDETLMLQAGEHRVISVSLDGRDERVNRTVFDRLLDDTNRRWRAALDHDGIDADPIDTAVRRQLLLLTDTDSGALFRSATTSLPLQRDGDRQIDERLCWIDDNSRWIRLLERGQRYDLADPTRRWLAEALRSSPDAARKSTGEQANSEHEVQGASGWRHHSPVRVSNSAASSVDLAAIAGASLVLDADRDRSTIERMATLLHEAWTAPDPTLDAGRWQGRKRRGTTNDRIDALPFVSAAIATRTALDAAARTVRRGNPLSEDAADWVMLSNELDRLLRSDGCFGTRGEGGWRRSFRDEQPDGQLLRWIAPVEPGEDLPRLRDDDDAEALARTRYAVDRLITQLGDGGLVHRHSSAIDDGFAPGQAADVAVSAEAVSACARIGRWEEAHQRMELFIALITRSDQLMFTVPGGLDPRTGHHFGNRPQAPALLAIAEARLLLRTGPR
jgi:GH15 family glucan-1,4-alpha-glucosidase